MHWYFLFLHFIAHFLFGVLGDNSVFSTLLSSPNALLLKEEESI